MKQYLLLSLLLVALSSFSLSGLAQVLDTGPDGGNKKAMVGEQIGITKILIEYDRPGVKGREGKIWGTGIAHYGFKDLWFGTSKNAPWRAGANENTTITFSEEVIVEGKTLAAGTYGLFMALSENETTVIFSTNSTSWGSFYYKEEEDALRVTVKNESLDESVEWLTYEFINQTPTSVTVALKWEKRMIPFKVESDLVNVHIASFKKQLRSDVGFVYQSYLQAVQFCLQNNAELEQALVWAEAAISEPYIGVRNFSTLLSKATVLRALDRTPEYKDTLKDLYEIGSMSELHQYGRNLLAAKRNAEALDVFRANYSKNPKEFMTAVGLGRGYSASGDDKNALKYFKIALPKAPDAANRTSVEEMIQKVKEGKDAN